MLPYIDIVMTIERTPEEIIVRLSPALDDATVKQVLKYSSYLESTYTSEAKQEDVDALVHDIKRMRP